MPEIYRNPLDVMLIRGTTDGQCTDSNTLGLVRNNGTKAHQGWDLLAPINTLTRAITDGKVAFSGSINGYGNCVIIEFKHHDQRLYALYGHLSLRLVTKGKVWRGNVVGLTGMSGNAAGTPPHLHFEILRTLNFRKGKLGLLDRIDPAEILGGAALSCHPAGSSPWRQDAPASSPTPTPAPTPTATPTPTGPQMLP
jgi:murein DD-endopeptidase MepM/ murein hydrolase activator NlpD